MKYRIKFHIVFLLFDECSDCSDPLLAMLADVLTSGYSPSTLGLSPSRFGRSEDGMPSDTAFRVRVGLVPSFIHLVTRTEQTDNHIGAHCIFH